MPRSRRTHVATVAGPSGLLAAGFGGLLAVALAGCGQKGPLVLPERGGGAVAREAPPAVTGPATAPAETAPRTAPPPVDPAEEDAGARKR